MKKWYCKHCNERITKLYGIWVRVTPYIYVNTTDCKPSPDNGHTPR